MRRFPCGAEIDRSFVDFRVWAPNCSKLEIIIEGEQTLLMEQEVGGYFRVRTDSVATDARYFFRLGKNKLFPDPASRFQPEGPLGPSQLIDPTQFSWTDKHWKGVSERNLVIYELHVGTFTPEGTWKSALSYLPYLAELGINVIEMMPISEFYGRFNWGYDGVNLFAPTHNYGTPDDLRAFIDAAHNLSIAVILDVVYNHFGPEGNSLLEFSTYYVQDKPTEWGAGINFDGVNNQFVREYYIANACYWIEEFHFDGLRFDACHALIDHSVQHILAHIVQKCREVAPDKKLYLCGENEQQQIRLIHPISQGGYGLDAIWNEDLHHTAWVRISGHQEAYCSDYKGKAQEFLSTAKYGFLYQGQWYPWQNQRRGTPCLTVRKNAFINFLENHDQVANVGGGLRMVLLSHPGVYRALSTFLLLAPQTPLLFQGQEFGSTTPFHYFSHHTPKLAEKIRQGRLEFVLQFPSLAHSLSNYTIPPPHDEHTFLASKLNWEEKDRNQPIYSLYRDLIYLRKTDSIFSHMDQIFMDGAALNDDLFLLRYENDQEGRLLLINLGMQFTLSPLPEPLMAPPVNQVWNVLWSSEQLEYGGLGYLTTLENGEWQMTGYSALILSSKRCR